MKRFRFELEALERVRKAKEQECLRLLSRAQSDYRDAIDRKSQIQNELLQAQKQREEQSAEGQTPFVSELAIQWDFITGTKQRLIQQDQAILRAKRSLEKVLRSYLFARRQTRMMEVLREKAYQAYRVQYRKDENKKLDDLYVMRHNLEVGLMSNKNKLGALDE